jgi:hypothetical protein
VSHEKILETKGLVEVDKTWSMGERGGSGLASVLLRFIGPAARRVSHVENKEFPQKFARHLYSSRFPMNQAWSIDGKRGAAWPRGFRVSLALLVTRQPCGR